MLTHRIVDKERVDNEELSRAFEKVGNEMSGADCPDDLPEVGTAAFDTWNRRRAELIEKDLSGKLEGSEREELEQLERLCGAAVEKAFPLPPVDLDRLIRLRDNLRAEKEGRGV
jgi:hypothetical protein